MDQREMRARVATARVGRLATVQPDGTPHVVPVCFAIVAGEIVTAVDAKPKSTRALRRLDNVRANPRIALLVDEYDDDWTQLWWVRVDGTATVVDMTGAYTAALAAKYGQYRDAAPAGPVIAITIDAVSGWSFASAADPDGGDRLA